MATQTPIQSQTGSTGAVLLPLYHQTCFEVANCLRVVKDLSVQVCRVNNYDQSPATVLSSVTAGKHVVCMFGGVYVWGLLMDICG